MVRDHMVGHALKDILRTNVLLTCIGTTPVINIMLYYIRCHKVTHYKTADV